MTRQETARRQRAVPRPGRLAVAEDAWTLQEIIQQAKRNLPHNVWDYIIGGTETETTLRRNRTAIDALAFKPRVLNDVSEIEAGGSLLGHDLRIPVLLPPIGSLQAMHPGGGAEAARAAEEFGIFQFVSSVCQPSLEEVAEASSAPKVFQLYLHGDEEWMDDIVARVIESGYAGLALTVDTAVYSRRERDLIKRWQVPSGSLGADFSAQARMSWATVDHLKSRYPELPLVLKGIQCAEDAAKACDHGCDVVYVSNHGGRQLDHALGGLQMLPEVVEAVDGRKEIVVDGGFLRGTDIVKGIALGATAVGVGRFECFGLAAGGATTLVRALKILEHEIRSCLGLLGVANISDVGPEHLVAAERVPDRGNEWHLTSAFPLLRLSNSDL